MERKAQNKAEENLLKAEQVNPFTVEKTPTRKRNTRRTSVKLRC